MLIPDDVMGIAGHDLLDVIKKGEEFRKPRFL